MRCNVVVVGNSVPVMSMPPRQHRAEGTYGELLVDWLAADGVDAHLALEGRWFDFAPAALKQYEERIRRHSPDVLILHFGLNESQPWLVPVTILRHLLRRHTTIRPAGLWYRRNVADPIWRGVRSYRRRASRLVGTRTWQVTPRRFVGTMRRMIDVAQKQLRPLVLVVDVNPPGERLEHFLPAQRRRHAIYQRALEDVVAGFDHDVRLVRASEVVERLGHDVAVPDDIHFSPVAHRAVAELLHAEVVAWLDRIDQHQDDGRGRPSQSANRSLGSANSSRSRSRSSSGRGG